MHMIAQRINLNKTKYEHPRALSQAEASLKLLRSATIDLRDVSPLTRTLSLSLSLTHTHTPT